MPVLQVSAKNPYTLLRPPPRSEDAEAKNYFTLLRGHWPAAALVCGHALNVFQLVSDAGAIDPISLRHQINPFPEEKGSAKVLEARPANVLFNLLISLDYLVADKNGLLSVRAGARSVLRRLERYGCLQLGSPHAQEMLQLLKTNKPRGSEENKVAYSWTDPNASLMSDQKSAKALTDALAGRAEYAASGLVEAQPLWSKDDALIDLGAGSGIYSFAYALQNPCLQAYLVDSRFVLQTASKNAEAYGLGTRNNFRNRKQIHFCAANFFDGVPETVLNETRGKNLTLLLSNTAHDYDIPQVQRLLSDFFQQVSIGTSLVIHDVLLDKHPRKLPAYSADLYSWTTGRAFTSQELYAVARNAGWTPVGRPQKTFGYCYAMKFQKMHNSRGSQLTNLEELGYLRTR